MEIKRGNTIITDIHLQNNSFVEEEIMGNHIAQLVFLSRHALELMIGDYITIGGKDFKIRNNEKVEKTETSIGWQYTVTFYSSQYELQDVSFFLHGAPERKKNFGYYNGTATQWLSLIVDNMNRNDSGWKTGSIIESRNINMSFKDKSCASVLTDLCKELDTEYWVSGKTISVGRREYAANGLRLGQGEGMGFKDLSLTAVSDTPPITVLYPYGSDKNITKEYGHDFLILPEGKLSIKKNTELFGHREQSVQFDDIFPKGKFKVTQKIDNFTLCASGIDFNLTDYLIGDGVEAIVTFQDGDLAGYDLVIMEDSWNNTTKEFKLKQNAEENALDVPGDINFKVGDTFILTNIKMPQKYITEAETELLEKATKHLDSICDKQVQLSGKCDDILFKHNNTHITCGQMVGIISDELNINREIRCTKVKKFLENNREPYRYEITVSDFLKGDGLRDLVNDVKNFPDEINSAVNPVKQFTKRTWQDVMQTREMLFDPESDYFTEIIQPLAVHTAQLIVGTNSQQMNFTGVKFIPNADDDPNYFKSTSGKLEHFTINSDGTIRVWSIPVSSQKLDNSKAYYVYAKCSHSGTNGTILVTEHKIKLEEESGYYHFWVGVLNTPIDKVRSWQPMYGYTEIAGQQITTGIIKDRLARLVIDLTKGTIYGQLTIKAGSSGLENLQEWEEVQKEIDDAQATADTAVKEIGETNLALNGFENTVNTTFKDGIIDASEAKAIEKYINTLNTEKADADAVYNQLYTNIYLTGTAKTNLTSSKTAYNTAHTNLIKAVNDAIADGKTTAVEKANVDSKFATYRTALADYSTKIEAANKTIQDELKKYSDNALTKAEVAQLAANNAQTSANTANTAVTNLNTYVDGAFSDGIISEVEAVSIEKYINSLNAEKANVDASYNSLYANTYLTGTAKTSLANTKIAYNTAHSNLISSINTAIADKKTTATEKTNVDNKFTAYRTALSNYSAAVENANKAIQDYLKSEFEADLDVQADRITAEVKRIDSLYNEKAGWITRSEGNTFWATKSEYNSLSGTVTNYASEIVQMANKITSTVSQDDYNGDKIVSLIHQTAAEITIQASKINLNGAITANDNVQITTDGRIIAKNATISGTITASSGSIANFKIEGSHIGTGQNSNGLGLSNSYIKFRSDTSQTEAIIGERVTPATSSIIAVARFTNRYVDSFLSVMNVAISINVSNSPVENRYIECTTDGGGIFSVGIKWIDSVARTIIRSSQLPHQGQVNTSQSYAVRYSVSDQCFYIQT